MIMGIILLFKGGYTNSTNKKTYIEVATSFGSTPRRVYELAHGRKAKNRREYEIQWVLQDKRIVALAR